LGNNNLVEKLSLQVESFQEGFEILCKSFSFEEMVKSFLHLMRGNFIISEILAYHKKQDASEWNIIASKRIPDPADLSFFKDTVNLSIQYYDKQKFDASIILPLSDKSFLGILIGPKMDKSGFADFDKITLQILLQVFDSAHKVFMNQKKEKTLIFELNEKVAQLNNLIDTVIEISRYDKRNILFELTLKRMASLTNASSALIQIGSKDQITQHYSFPPNIDKSEILNSKFKLQSSFEYNDISYFFTLAEKETRTGVTNFNDLDKLLLDAITKQVQASIENEYLLKQSLEKQRIEQEINVAASIQQRIIPKELPKIEGFEVSGINIPSREVGGDYYDCIKLSNGKYALIIADVAGKGIGAALLVSTLNAALSSYLEFDLPLTEISDKLNKLIYKSSPSDKFITFFIAVLDPKTGELDIVNAGHNPILLLRKDNTLEKLDAGGVGLGMFDFGIPYTGQKSTMNSGDKLFLYTDGIPEAMNENEEEYSDEKMIKFFENNSGKPTNEFVDELVKDIKSYAGLAQQSDDITVLILKRI
jgi:sigma-B regulation protein RsbU (phosphoserine phosphatase)